jgi:hypothetical protein
MNDGTIDSSIYTSILRGRVYDISQAYNIGIIKNILLDNFMPANIDTPIYVNNNYQNGFTLTSKGATIQLLWVDPYWFVLASNNTVFY